MLKCLLFTRDFIIFDAFWSIDSILKGHGLVSIERSVPLSHTLPKLLGKHMLCSTHICFIRRDQGMDLAAAAAHSLTLRSVEHIWLLLRMSCVRLTFQQLWPLHITALMLLCVLHSEWWMWMAFAAHFTSAMQHINTLHYLRKVNCVLIWQTFCYLEEHALMTH